MKDGSPTATILLEGRLLSWEGFVRRESSGVLSQVQARCSWGHATLNVHDFFHRLRIKPQLGRLFRLPSMSAGTFYVIEVEGRRVGPETQIWPHWLPTGFSVVAVLRARGSSRSFAELRVICFPVLKQKNRFFSRPGRETLRGDTCYATVCMWTSFGCSVTNSVLTRAFPPHGLLLQKSDLTSGHTERTAAFMETSR